MLLTTSILAQREGYKILFIYFWSRVPLQVPFNQYFVGIEDVQYILVLWGNNFDIQYYTVLLMVRSLGILGGGGGIKISPMSKAIAATSSEQV